jgi:hypothetical protein
MAAAAVLLLGAAAAQSAHAATVTCALSKADVVFGSQLTVSGVVDPAVEGDTVSVALGGVEVAQATTGADGGFSATFVPAAGGAVTATLVSDGSASQPVSLVVRPAVTISRGTAVPFLKTRFVLQVKPAAYTGRIVARVWHRGGRVATVKGTCRNGRLALAVPLPGIEWFTVRFALTSAGGLSGREVSSKVDVGWRTLSRGSQGARVRGLLTRLVQLRIRTPGIGDTFTSAVGDAVVAFQKAYRISRDYRIDYEDWRRLETAWLRKPKYTSPSTHIEIDKTRQILSVVRDGVVIGTIPVSTGATGNTPSGAFTILNKNYMSSTYDGSVALPRFMRFYRTMGMHGYPVVPPYQASHGCVREPLWVCDWVYDRSFVGERVYIFL